MITIYNEIKYISSFVTFDSEKRDSKRNIWQIPLIAKNVFNY